MTDRKMTLEATGEFPFKFFIEKALPSDVDGELVIEGVASTPNVDHDNERMAPDALKSMANVINKESVPLRVEHSKSENAVIGSVRKAWVDERNQLHIQAVLDKSHPVSAILHDSMKLGKKMGFSVGGLVKRAAREFVESVGKVVKTFYDVELKEVSVTPRPANYDSWAVAKSIARDEAEAEKTRSTGWFNEFLFENPQLDYLQSFAKSVPDAAWRRSDSSLDKSENSMKDEETTKKEDMKDSTDEGTEKAVSRGEFTALKSTIEKGFSALAGFMEKMDVAAHDQNAPGKDKDKPEEVKAKAQDGAKDTNSPDKMKPDPEKVTAKAGGREGQEDMGGNGSDENGQREKSDKTDDYKLETVERSIARIEAVGKSMEAKKTSDKDETKEKTTKEDETEKKADMEDEETAKADDDSETKEKTAHPLDQFVAAVAKTIEAMGARLEKGGKTVLGFEKHMVETVLNSPEMQEEITKMMKIPGRKQSVSMGVPYMTTKEGKRYQLVAQESAETTVEKSARQNADGKPLSFKDVYKKDFGSIREGQDQ